MRRRGVRDLFFKDRQPAEEMFPFGLAAAQDRFHFRFGARPPPLQFAVKIAEFGVERLAGLGDLAVRPADRFLNRDDFPAQRGDALRARAAARGSLPSSCAFARSLASRSR